MLSLLVSMGPDSVNLRFATRFYRKSPLLLTPMTLLLAVGFPRCGSEDFRDIARRVGRIAPDIKTHVFHP
jgi:hypothetical protein